MPSQRNIFPLNASDDEVKTLFNKVSRVQQKYYAYVKDPTPRLVTPGQNVYMEKLDELLAEENLSKDRFMNGLAGMQAVGLFTRGVKTASDYKMLQKPQTLLANPSVCVGTRNLYNPQVDRIDINNGPTRDFYKQFMNVFTTQDTSITNMANYSPEFQSFMVPWLSNDIKIGGWRQYTKYIRRGARILQVAGAVGACTPAVAPAAVVGALGVVAEGALDVVEFLSPANNDQLQVRVEAYCRVLSHHNHISAFERSVMCSMVLKNLENASPEVRQILELQIAEFNGMAVNEARVDPQEKKQDFIQSGCEALSTTNIEQLEGVRNDVQVLGEIASLAARLFGNPKLGNKIEQGGKGLVKIFDGRIMQLKKLLGASDAASIGTLAPIGSMVLGVMMIASVLLSDDDGPDANQIIIDMLQQILREIRDFRDHVDGRLDDIDRQLSHMEAIMNSTFYALQNQLNDVLSFQRHFYREITSRIDTLHGDMYNGFTNIVLNEFREKKRLVGEIGTIIPLTDNLFTEYYLSFLGVSMNHASLPNINGQDFNDRLFSEKKALHFDPGSYFGKLGSHITENHCNHPCLQTSSNVTNPIVINDAAGAMIQLFTIGRRYEFEYSVEHWNGLNSLREIISNSQSFMRNFRSNNSIILTNLLQDYKEKVQKLNEELIRLRKEYLEQKRNRPLEISFDNDLAVFDNVAEVVVPNPLDRSCSDWIGETQKDLKEVLNLHHKQIHQYREECKKIKDKKKTTQRSFLARPIVRNPPPEIPTDSRDCGVINAAIRIQNFYKTKIQRSGRTRVEEYNFDLQKCQNKLVQQKASAASDDFKKLKVTATRSMLSNVILPSPSNSAANQVPLVLRSAKMKNEIESKLRSSTFGLFDAERMGLGRLRMYHRVSKTKGPGTPAITVDVKFEMLHGALQIYDVMSLELNHNFLQFPDKGLDDWDTYLDCVARPLPPVWQGWVLNEVICTSVTRDKWNTYKCYTGCDYKGGKNTLSHLSGKNMSSVTFNARVTTSAIQSCEDQLNLLKEGFSAKIENACNANGADDLGTILHNIGKTRILIHMVVLFGYKAEVSSNHAIKDALKVPNANITDGLWDYDSARAACMKYSRDDNGDQVGNLNKVISTVNSLKTTAHSLDTPEDLNEIETMFDGTLELLNMMMECIN